MVAAAEEYILDQNCQAGYMDWSRGDDDTNLRSTSKHNKTIGYHSQSKQSELFAQQWAN